MFHFNDFVAQLDFIAKRIYFVIKSRENCYKQQLHTIFRIDNISVLYLY